ncbi:MAG: MATE family efflux transporter [Clostridiales bacterium]|nr:MATE family efflux transporter [Clostridiales bacterium]
MGDENSLTQGNLLHAMVRFSVPYFIASFLQTFYGMADLFITGQFNGTAQVTAVSIGSQVMHMFTVIVVGLAMGTTVAIGYAVGAREQRKVALTIGNSVTLFTAIAVISTGGLLLNISNFLTLLKTPAESVDAAYRYLFVCFIGVPFIVAYNVISSIYRGLGDTKHPMIFVGISGIFNIGLDYLFVGAFHLGAAGAAIATVTAQVVSVLMALIFMRKMNGDIKVSPRDLRPQSNTARQLLRVGTPIACQDGLIQVSFLVITMIANMRGLEVATAVGIVEKVISFLFLVPSAMLSTISALTAQNIGAGLHIKGQKTLRYGIILCVGFGVMVSIVCQFIAPQIVSLFVKGEPQVVSYGGQYLRSYCLDCVFAGIHFCFSGYFSAYGKSLYSFAHNIISILLIRIPVAYITSLLFPETLFPMGLAAPMGSLLSAFICIFFYQLLIRKAAIQNHLAERYAH